MLRYRDTLDEILRFYDFLYDPKHGRNLSVGMVAGYLLCEHFKTPHVIEVFAQRYDECKDVLLRHEKMVRAVLEGRASADSLDDTEEERQDLNEVLPDEASREKARQAAANIIARRKGVTLGGLRIKDLINEGRR